MYEVIRNEYEQEAIRFLTDRYVNGGDWVNVREFPRYEELGEQDIQRVVARFVNFGLLRGRQPTPWTSTSKSSKLPTSLMPAVRYWMAGKRLPVCSWPVCCITPLSPSNEWTTAESGFA